MPVPPSSRSKDNSNNSNCSKLASSFAHRDKAIPPVPVVPSLKKHHGRSRSKCDVVLASPVADTMAPSPRKLLATATAKKSASTPKEELEALIKYGLNGNTPIALQNLRRWIFYKGVDADSNGFAKDRCFPMTNELHFAYIFIIGVSSSLDSIVATFGSLLDGSASVRQYSPPLPSAYSDCSEKFHLTVQSSWAHATSCSHNLKWTMRTLPSLQAFSHATR